MKVYGHAVSTASQRVFACLYEKGLDFELVPVNLVTGEHKKESFLSLNPFGQVPAFEDGDLKLFESRAITQYIALNYAGKGNKLVFDDPKKAATMTVWKEVEALHFDTATTTLGWELIFKSLFGLATDPKVVEENEAKLVKVLDVYEARLGQSKYMGGDAFSLVDLHHLPNIQTMMGTDLKKHFESRPKVSAWCADILCRPSWVKVLEMKKNQA
ncbi:glutathione S-transferase-like [Diospyros lotus]|uniref:glutathione S-transferase-like n=1 Tax=Diospyros lotus TaxID=55363 RepID=UPI00224FDB35|nr:glutathione S-transferase-like [Diospyros lotus]